jgi:hypothetical protein
MPNVVKQVALSTRDAALQSFWGALGGMLWRWWGAALLATLASLGGAILSMLLGLSHVWLQCAIGALGASAFIVIVGLVLAYTRRQNLSTPDTVVSAVGSDISALQSVAGFPAARIKIVCDGSLVSLLVTNEGSAADFYGVFNISGQVNAKITEGLFCLWAHTYSTRTTIAKGQTCRILLAELSESMGFAQWRIHQTTERGPVDILAHYTSCRVSIPVARAPEIVLAGSIVAIPDLSNGLQHFNVVLEAFGAKVGLNA